MQYSRNKTEDMLREGVGSSTSAVKVFTVILLIVPATLFYLMTGTPLGAGLENRMGLLMWIGIISAVSLVSLPYFFWRRSKYAGALREFEQNPDHYLLIEDGVLHTHYQHADEMAGFVQIVLGGSDRIPLSAIEMIVVWIVSYSHASEDEKTLVVLWHDREVSSLKETWVRQDMLSEPLEKIADEIVKNGIRAKVAWSDTVRHGHNIDFKAIARGRDSLYVIKLEPYLPERTYAIEDLRLEKR